MRCPRLAFAWHVRRRPARAPPAPRPPVRRCGATNAKGTHDSVDDAAARETPAQAAERLARESADTKASIM